MSHRELPVIQFVCVLPRPCPPKAITMPVASQSLRASLTQCSRRLPQPCTLSSISSVRFASQGAPHYNEPSGWLFGEKPPPPGQKRQREDWEMIWYIGMFGSLALGAVLHYFKPDKSIQTWALAEAKKRMEARGEPTDYVPSE